MECSLGMNNDERTDNGVLRLNPYSNGMLTWSGQRHSLNRRLCRLNPYSNGMLTWIIERSFEIF